MRLSLSMIVKNEERFLPGCLESVKALVDEMVIADTGSTDGTKEIAISFGAKVIDYPWRNDFSAARNESLRHATGDWILYLDADERIDASYHALIRKIISSRKADAYLLNLKSKIGTREDAQYHLVAYPRLFRKMKDVFFTGQVHEQVTPSLLKASARIIPSDVIIDHLGYAQDDDVILEKARRNRVLLLSQVEKRENYGYALYQLGQTEIVLGNIDAGLLRLEEALAAGGIGDSVVASIHGIIAENLMKRGNYDAAILACDRSLASAPTQSFAHILKGDVLAKLGNHSDSVKEYTSALKEYESGILEGKAHTAVEPVFDKYVLYARIANAALLAGDEGTAVTYFGKAARQKRTPHNVTRYVELLVKKGMLDEAAKSADEFSEFKEEDWYLRLMSSVFMEKGDYDQASRFLGCVSSHDAVSLGSLAKCRMKGEDFTGAEYAFLQAVELGYDDENGLELLGLVQFKLLKFTEAADTLARVVKANPSNARAAKFLQAARSQVVSSALAR